MKSRIPLAVLPLAVAALLAPAPPAAAQSAILNLGAVSPESGVYSRTFGATGSGHLGVPVAGGQDVDGDGLPDYAIAFFTASPEGRFAAGEVDLIFGDGTIRGTLDTALPQPSLLRVWGSHERETAGNEIWIDDVTGDGLGDLLVCRQNFTPSPQQTGVGALTVIAGGPHLAARAAALSPLDLADATPRPGVFTIVGQEPLGRFCIWVRTGDVDGDGIADLVVGADQEDSRGEADAGALYVILGGEHLAGSGSENVGTPGPALAGWVARILPPPGAAGFHFASTTAAADLDGDGRAEVMASAALNRGGAAVDPPGAPGTADAAGGSPSGTFFLAWSDNFPPPPWPAGFGFSMDAAPGSVTIIVGGPENQIFGEEILGGFDADGDGRSELFVGDFLADPGPARANAGIGWVFYDVAQLKGTSFALDAPLVDFRVTLILGALPGSIAADAAIAADVDADGFDDLLFAAPHADPPGRPRAGLAHLLYGRPGGWPAVVDTARGQEPPRSELRMVEIVGARGRVGTDDQGDTLAYSVAAGDMNGDGHADLLVNEMVGNGVAPTAIDVGNLVILNGRRLPLATPGGWRRGPRGPVAAPVAPGPLRRW